MIAISPMPRRTAQQSFTLVEVLVALALAGILLAALASFFISSLHAAAVADARNEVLAETILAQQLITSKVRQAWYVVPNGTTLNLGTGFTTRNPAGGNRYTVGTHHVAAMVLPPAGAGGEYQLLVYYPLLRSVMVQNASGANRPQPDPVGDARSWLLMELRQNLGTGRPFDPSLAPGAGGMNTSYGGVPGRILLDYVRPPLAGEPPLLAPIVVGGRTVGVNITLQSERRLHGRTIRVPGAPQTVGVYARNVAR